MISRRSFMSSILALGTAPAIVKAESLMRVFEVKQRMIPIVFGTCRFEGRIIWQSDFAAGPVQSVTRIWADGRLIYPL